jgi:exodeoxyribonuclease V alpha subunit
MEMTEETKLNYPVLREFLKMDLQEMGIHDEQTIESLLRNLFEPQKYTEISSSISYPKAESLFSWKDGILRSKREVSIRNSISKAFESSMVRKLNIDTEILKDLSKLFSLTEEQSQAVKLCIESPFFILTGGPGTGKTTTAASILYYFLLMGIPADKISIAAPTGRAAGRITESIQDSFQKLSTKKDKTISSEILSRFQASTIHRLLSYSHSKNIFLKNKENPLMAELVLVDEASMLSPDLFSKICDALSSNCRLILLGDSYQLPPVDSEKLFSPLLEGKFTQKKPIFKEITKNFRSEFSPQLDALLRSIKKRDTNLVQEQNWEYFSKEKVSSLFSYLDSEQPKVILVDNTFFQDEDLYELFWKNYLDTILKSVLQTSLYSDSSIELWKNVQRYQVLTSLKKTGMESSNKINQEIEKFINLKDWILPKIMTYNDYSLGIFNGDMGVQKKDHYLFPTERGTKSIPLTTSGIESAFAITVHKAQGSQYENTIVVLPNDPQHELNTNEMLYTAVSRAKRNVMILSRPEILERAILGK